MLEFVSSRSLQTDDEPMLLFWRKALGNSGLCPSFHPMLRIVKGPASKSFVGGRPYFILSPGDGSALFSGCPALTAAAARNHMDPDTHGSLFLGKMSIVKGRYRQEKG